MSSLTERVVDGAVLYFFWTNNLNVGRSRSSALAYLGAWGMSGLWPLIKNCHKIRK